jgi:hypothetical protein
MMNMESQERKQLLAITLRDEKTKNVTMIRLGYNMTYIYVVLNNC